MLRKEIDLYKHKEEAVTEGELLIFPMADFHCWIFYVKLLRRKNKKPRRRNKSLLRWPAKGNLSKNSALTFWYRLRRLRKPSRRNEKVIKLTHHQFLSYAFETSANARILVRAAERNALSSQASRNAPELLFWEDYLGMRIEGAGVPDHLKIIYTHIIDSDWMKQFHFIINMVTRDYEGTHLMLSKHRDRVV